MTASAPTSLDDLVAMNQAALDELFKSLECGPIPEGESKGAAIVHPGTWRAKVLRWIAYRFAWQGKIVTKSPYCSCATLVNKVGPVRFRAIVARVYFDDSWLDGKKCIHIDYSATSFLARKVRDEIRQVIPGLYLGKVWWGRTRLIDFALQFQHPVHDGAATTGTVA